MKKVFTQIELINLLKSNPLNCEVFFNEKGKTILNNSDYIFVDLILDKNILADNKVKMIVNQIQIDFYVNDFDNYISLKKFIQSNFIGFFTHQKEDHYNRGILTTDIFVKDWGCL